MAINFKKILLAGTALVAVSAFGAQAQAAALTTVPTGIWAGTSAGVGDHSTTVKAVAGDTADINAGATLTITNDGTANDGSVNTNTFAPGAITNTALTGQLAITNGAANAALAVTIDSVNIDGAVTLTTKNSALTSQTVVITNGLTTNGALMLDNSLQATAAKALSLSVGGNLNVAGLTTLKTGTFAGAATTALTVTGNATFTGGVSLLPTSNAADTAILTLNGATNTFGTGTGLVMTDSTGLATLKVTGTTNQTIAGVISGGGAGQGALIVANDGLAHAGGTTVEFQGAVGSAATLKSALIGVAGQTVAQNVKFDRDVKVANNGVVLGNGSAAIITAILDNTAGAQAVNSKIDGDGTATAKVIVQGGNTTTAGAAWGGAQTLTNLTVTGAGTVLATGANNITSTAFTLASGGKIDTTGASTLTGTIDGAGTLAVDADTTVTGNIGTATALTAINVSTTGKTLTARGDVKATTTTLTGTGTLALTVGATHAVTTNIAAAVDNNGVITIADVNGSVTTITGNIGASDKKITSLTVTDGGGTTTTTTTGNLYVNAISLGASDTLEFLATGVNTSAQTVSGTVAGAAAGKGILTVGNGTTTSNVTFSGAVGGGGNTLASMTTSAAATANFSSSAAIAGAFTSSGTTNFAGAGASTLTGVVTNIGTINVTGAGTVTTGNIGNGAAGTVHLSGGNMTSTGSLTSSGALTVDAGRTLTAATQVATDGAYNFGFTASNLGAVSSGKLTLSGGAVNMATVASTVAVTIPAGAGYIASGSVSKIATGTAIVNKDFAAGSDALVHAVTSDNSALYSFQYARGDNAVVFAADGAATNADIYLIATRAAVTSALGTAITPTDTTTNTALIAVGIAPNTAAGNLINTVQGNVAAAATVAALHTVLEQVTPTVDGGIQDASFDIGAQTQEIADVRMASLRSGDGTAGMAAGASANGVTMWLQGYGQSGNQDARGGVEGYNSNTLGGAVGVDTTSLIDNGSIGVAVNYGKTNIDSDNANTTATDIDTYGINLYSNYDLGQQMFLNGQLGYGYNTINADRHNAGGAGRTANGDFHSTQYSGKLALGRDYSQDYGMTLTPVVSAAYTHLNSSGYTETGTGVLQSNASQTMQALNLGFGATASWKMKNADGSLMKPNLHAGYAYDAIGDRVEASSTWVGAPAVAAFTTKGASPARSQFNAGVGMVYMTAADWDLSANYDFRYKSDFTSHSGVLRASSHF